ncbi:glycosyltransferase family 4 protein [Sulfuriferula plumbiphila]|uniref:glycosyltransferase family 4 protein n=1 Tax=Sulfuriferula plumbiphila TaxID=171865 RepID=UPI0018E0B00E|nr:glycosyltransferase family 1 protein [Sulfuriferula plumbiphila]
MIDVTRLVDRFMRGRLPTGVDRVGLAYVHHYGHRAQAVVRWAGHSWVLPRAQSDKLFEWLFAPTTGRTAVRHIASGMLAGWNAQGVAGRFLFNTGHSGLERVVYPAMLRRMQVKPLFLVHDLIPITHPEYCRAGEDARHISRMNNVLALASGVITNSQATLGQLALFARHSGQAMPPSVAVLLAPGMLAATAGARPMEAPYFVILSTIEPRKNHWLLLQVWRRLVERLGAQAPRLVVIGQRGWECENVVDLLERCAPLRGFVSEHSSCSDAELVTYLHHAQALLFPSFVEGYGMPLVEALALGVPVIASDLPVFREIAAGIPEYVDPLDGKRWGELVMEYAQPQSQSRAAQLVRLADFKVPGWPDHFAKVDALLTQLSESEQHG